MQRNGIRIIIQLCSAILLFFTASWYTLADDCFIESGAAGNYTMILPQQNYSIPTRMVTQPEEISDASREVPIKLKIADGIGCKGKLNGDSSVHFINTADPSMLSTYTTNHGYALLKTTVPGITYSVELICRNCGSADDIDLYLPVSGDNSISNADGKWTYEDSDNSWSLGFRFYTTPEFKPKNGVSDGTLIPGQIATWYIGNGGQPRVNFLVDTTSAHFYVDQPTCTIISLDESKGNTSGNEVTLGNNYISEIKSGVSREVPFTIRGDYCFASKITVKLKAANKPADSSLVGKSSGSATGVAVKVQSTYNNSKVLLKADGSNAIDYEFAIWSNNLLEFPFTAQLVPDGSNAAIGTGDFKGNTTFTFTYE